MGFSATTSPAVEQFGLAIIEAIRSMSQTFVEIEGFRCYAPDVALACDDYPSDGFDVTARIEARSFLEGANCSAMIETMKQR